MNAPATPCVFDCAETNSIALNRDCGCEIVDVGRVRESFAMRHPGALDPVLHAHLFSPFALFVDRPALDTMAAVARAVFKVARQADYLQQVLQHAPPIANAATSSAGGVLGFDFHLTVAGPRLIEINTNPGGLLLNALLVDLVQSCEPYAWMPWATGDDARDTSISAWLDDAICQIGRMPRRIAIVDVAPCEQFLFPEFELYAAAFRERGIDCVIREPGNLAWRDGALHDEAGRLDMVYNRLTDFALANEENAALAQAWRNHAIALTPHPRAHAVFADKRNLPILRDARQLVSAGVDAAVAECLEKAIPRTVVLTAANRDALWAARDGLFFKPAGGYGSRGSYRGDKLTRRTWDALPSGTHVAQELAPPSVRVLHGGRSLKADLRCYASESAIHLFAARLYQGQTTNMRTPGGGFAAVLTTPDRSH